MAASVSSSGAAGSRPIPEGSVVGIPAQGGRAVGIEVERLTKVYPGSTVRSAALNDVSLRFGAADLVVVIGRSGAGKSTLLRCMNLLIRPTSGRVVIDGVDVTDATGGRLRRVRGQVGMIFQGFNLVRRLSVLQNVLAGRLRFQSGPIAGLRSVLRVHARRDRELAFECLKKVGIEHLAFRRADALSGGQQQRVAIARVLAQEPSAILADEPIASLDPASAEVVMSTLAEIQRTRRIPVVVNLHQVEVARAYATRIVGMSQGAVRFDGGPAELTDGAVQGIYAEQARGQDEPRSEPDARALASGVVGPSVSRGLGGADEMIKVRLAAGRDAGHPALGVNA